MGASICIVDYRRGNIASVRRGLADAGYDAFISTDPADIERADGLVLPGVGAFADAMEILNASGQAASIRREVAAGKPFLGICLGQQLIFERGSEGCEPGEWTDGLGLIAGEVLRMPALTNEGERLKVPHVGWNSLELTRDDNPLFANIPDGSYFYYTHSYVGVPADTADIAGVTVHAQPFTGALRRGNIYATQFHPEKSSAIGLRLLANFGRIVEEACS